MLTQRLQIDNIQKILPEHSNSTFDKKQKSPKE
jgi:hypothetical protein